MTRSAADSLAVASNDARLTVSGARIHTLSNVTCDIPIGRLIAVTGVSGSGKSSFIRGILVPALARELPDRVDAEGFAWEGGVWDHVEGASRVSSVLALEPRTPSAQRRSAVATLLGLADDLRKIFARCPDASRLGLKATDFGWNAGPRPLSNLPRVRARSKIDDGCGGMSPTVAAVGSEKKSSASVWPATASRTFWSCPSTNCCPIRSRMRVDGRMLLEQLVALDLGYLTLGRRLDQNQRGRASAPADRAGTGQPASARAAARAGRTVGRPPSPRCAAAAAGPRPRRRWWRQHGAPGRTQPGPDSCFRLDYRLRSRWGAGWRPRCGSGAPVRNCRCRHRDRARPGR